MATATWPSDPLHVTNAETAQHGRWHAQGDEDTLRKMLGGGRRVLAQSVDENRRRSVSPEVTSFALFSEHLLAASPST